MGNASWYSTGFDAADQEKVERERRRNTPWRFFLKQGQATEIIFLDDFSQTHKIKLPNGDEIERPIVPFSIDEHNLTVDGDWKNWYTCLKKIDPPCPICSAGYRPYYVGMLSILAKWVDESSTALSGFDASFLRRATFSSASTRLLVRGIALRLRAMTMRLSRE
jgi:hypothetical protein